MKDTTILPQKSCPTCNSKYSRIFAAENIQPEKLNAYSYASRKEPEYMCYELLQCLDCMLVYTSSQKKIDLNDTYIPAAYNSEEEANYAAQSYMQAIVPFLKELPSLDLAVDVGAGNGSFLLHLLKYGFQNVMGIEPSKAAIAAAPSSIQPLLKQEGFSQQSLAGEKPSLICSFMTLEHLSDYNQFIHIAFESLMPGGILALVTHNYTSWINRLLGKHSPIIDIEHLQLFCPEALKIALYKAGFNNVHIQPLTNQYPIRYLIKLFPLPLYIKKYIIQSLYSSSRFENFFCYPINLNLGNILSICRKL